MQNNSEEKNVNIGAHSTLKNEPKEKKESFIGEVTRLSIFALIIVLFVRIFIAQPFVVSGASMEHTFSTGQYLIVDQLTYRFNEPKRGDVIVFRYPKDPSKYFIKRIIGVPGDTVIIHGNQVTIKNKDHQNGIVLDEHSYVPHMSEDNNETRTLGSDEYFVMGDNRDQSSDSRIWGVLNRDLIMGRALLRLFPFNELGVFPGNYDINAELDKPNNTAT